MSRTFCAVTLILLVALPIQQQVAADDGKSDVPLPNIRKPLPAKPAARIQVRPQILLAVPNVRTTREPTSLLRNTQVQEELKLAVDQQNKIKEIYQQQNSKRTEHFQAIRNLQGAERIKKNAEWRKQMDVAAKETRQKLRQLLKPEQQARLDQIALQMQGQRVWQDPTIIKTLEISEQQQEQFKELEEASAAKRRQLFQDRRAGNVDRAQYAEKLKEISKSQEAKSQQVLSKQQQEHFKKMAGKKFEMRAPAFPGGAGRLPALKGQPRKLQVQPRPAGKLQKVPPQPQKTKTR